MSEVKDFQEEIKDKLKESLADVETEWNAFKRSEGIYSPRIDIAIGPYSIEPGTKRDEYADLNSKHNSFIEKLIYFHNKNIDDYLKKGDYPFELSDIKNKLKSSYQKLIAANENARCWIAIEIENQVSRKHLLGGAMNACALGSIGICIGWTQANEKALVRLQAYWTRLTDYGKLSFSPENLIILNPEQLKNAISELVPP